MTLTSLVGVFFICGGAGRNSNHLWGSLAFGLAAGALIGTYTVWDAYTVAILLVPPLLLDYASSLGRAIFLAPYAATRSSAVTRHWRENRWPVIWIAVFNPLAYILVLVALTTTPVVYVAPARELSVLITVLMGVFLLGEGATRQRLGWAVVVVSGIVLLATA